MLSLRQNKRSVFSRTCAGKRHPESRERGDRKGVNGGKREGERSEQESVVPRQNKVSRRDGGHAPPQRHPERSAATTKTRFTGRKQNKRSEFCCLPVFICCLPASQHFSFSLLTFSFVCGYNIDCCLMRYIGPYFRRIFELLSGGAFQCSEHISPRNVTERWSTASEREWRTPTAEKSLQDVALKAEQDSPIKAKSIRSV